VPVHVLAAILTLLLLWSPAANLHAQAPDRQSSSAVFGAPDPRQSPEEGSDGGLNVSGWLFGAYGDEFLSGRAPVTPLQSDPRSHGSYYGFSGRLLYDRLGEQLSMRVNAASTAGYYPAFERFVVRRQFVDISSSWIASPWRTAHVSTVGTAVYSQYGAPFTEVMSSPDSQSVEVPEGDDLFGSHRRGTLRGRVQLEQDWGRRKSIGVMAGVQSSVLERSERIDAYDLGGSFNARIARYGTFRTGYTRQAVDRGLVRYLVHQANLGGDYGRPLSTSRRTFVSFSGGTAALESRDSFRVFVTADARLSHELGRSWTGRVRYHRGITFVDEIAAPLLFQGLNADLNGLLSRRIDVGGTASLRQGTAGVSRAPSNYHVYGAVGRIRLALSRRAAVYAEYLFYHYRFGASVPLAASLPYYFDQQTVRVGVTVMTQLLR
jgi:hypothetical protein